MADIKLTLREWLLVISFILSVVVFWGNVQSWKTKVEDHMDEIERHLESNDARLDKLQQELNALTGISIQRSRR
jgi:cell division protein FtsL